MTRLILLGIIIVASAGSEVSRSQTSTDTATVPMRGDQSKCSQPIAQQESLIREAAENKYSVRRVEFVGNARTRDDVLRRMITLQEGDVFTRENLVGSLENVSTLKKIIYPVKLSDVIVHLDTAEKTIDMTICFRERRRP